MALLPLHPGRITDKHVEGQVNCLALPAFPVGCMTQVLSMLQH